MVFLQMKVKPVQTPRGDLEKLAILFPSLPHPKGEAGFLINLLQILYPCFLTTKKCYWRIPLLVFSTTGLHETSSHQWPFKERRERKGLLFSAEFNPNILLGFCSWLPYLTVILHWTIWKGSFFPCETQRVLPPLFWIYLTAFLKGSYVYCF